MYSINLNKVFNNNISWKKRKVNEAENKTSTFRVEAVTFSASYSKLVIGFTNYNLFMSAFTT